jgi:hypothetical protein
MVAIVCLLALCYLFILKIGVYEKGELDYSSRKALLLHIFLAFLAALSSYAVSSASYLGFILFVLNAVNYEKEFFGLIYGPISFFYIMLYPFFIKKKRYAVYYIVLVIVPFLIFWPKSLLNETCTADSPRDKAVGLWNGQKASFQIISGNSPTEYNIANLETNEHMGDYHIAGYVGQNQCLGFSSDGHCAGIAIPTCNIPTDYAQYQQGKLRPTLTPEPTL